MHSSHISFAIWVSILNMWLIKKTFNQAINGFMTFLVLMYDYFVLFKPAREFFAKLSCNYSFSYCKALKTLLHREKSHYFNINASKKALDVHWYYSLLICRLNSYSGISWLQRQWNNKCINIVCAVYVYRTCFSSGGCSGSHARARGNCQVFHAKREHKVTKKQGPTGCIIP